MKPSPHSAMQREIVSGEGSILTPSSFNTSAEPEREEIARLPCFATGTPAPATTKAAQVEMLKVPLPSPPVPHVSMAPAGARTAKTFARMARAAPAISSTVSPRTRSPMTSALICAGVAAPDITRSKASAASSWLRLLPVAILAIAPCRSPRIAVRASTGSEGTDRFSWVRRSCAPLYPGKIEEVGKELMPVLRRNALGVELNAVHGIALMLHAHDHAVGGLSGDFQHVGKARTLYDERVVTRGREVLRKAGKHALAAVMHLGELPMHQGRRPHHPAAIDLADCLVAETDAEDRHVGSSTFDKLEADAGPVWVARAGRQHDGLRRLGKHLIDGDLVVAVDARRRAQFPEEMHEVVGKAVVIVDQRQHGDPVTPASRAPSSYERLLHVKA